MLAAVLAAVAVHTAIGLAAWSRTEAGSVESMDEPVPVEIVFEPPPVVAPPADMPPAVTPAAEVVADRPSPEQAPAPAPSPPVTVPTEARQPPAVARPGGRPPAPRRPAPVTERRFRSVAEPSSETPAEASREVASSASPAATATPTTESTGSSSGLSMADAAENPPPGKVAGLDEDWAKEPAADASHKARGGETGGGGADAGPSRAALVASYGRIVWEQVLAHRPAGRRRAGSTRLSFTIAPDGALLSAGIARSSGSDELDRLALGTLRDAAPFPPPPPALRSAPLAFVIAFEFR